MDSKKIIETAVLKTSLNFQLLDFIEELIESNDSEALNIINKFFSTKKSFTYQIATPLICIETPLGMMASVVFFANAKKVKLSDNTKKCILQKGYSDEEILKIIRNSIAHWADDDHQNIEFCEDSIEFKSRNKSVNMSLPNGLHFFVMDIIKETRSSMKT